MNDTAKCSGILEGRDYPSEGIMTCPLRGKCYRYIIKPAELLQWWTEAHYSLSTGKCELFNEVSG